MARRKASCTFSVHVGARAPVSWLFLLCGMAMLPVTSLVFLKHLETPAKILAKKVVFRGAQLQPHDMFDIAATAKTREPA